MTVYACSPCCVSHRARLRALDARVRCISAKERRTFTTACTVLQRARAATSGVNTTHIHST